jgi:hypothetical protein
MAHVTIEYVILIPVLIVQIFFFPYVASMITDSWADSRRTLELQEVAGHLGSSIQQLYYTINHASLPNGTMVINLDIPQLIEDYPYNATLRHMPSQDGSYQVMNVTLQMRGSKSAASTIVTLGDNVDWIENLSFNSTQRELSLIANKTSNFVLITIGGAY